MTPLWVAAPLQLLQHSYKIEKFLQKREITGVNHQSVKELLTIALLSSSGFSSLPSLLWPPVAGSVEEAEGSPVRKGWRSGVWRLRKSCRKAMEEGVAEIGRVY